MPVSVCFVCLGNICRSPTAEGVMRHLVRQAGLEHEIEIDSAGTGDWHVGERADARSRAVAKSRGFELESRARQFQREDFARFDHVIAMDRKNRDSLVRLAGGDQTAIAKIALLRELANHAETDVPDPYFEDNFDLVFDICESGCKALLDHLVERHDL